MKRCTKCNKSKNEIEFGKRKASKDGLSSSCKECQSEYDKSRANLKHRAEQRKEYQKTDAYTESHRKASLKYAKTDQGKVSGKEWKNRNPKKVRVYGVVNYHIKTGNLVKQPCEVCGCKEVHAHHDDYDKPLEIRWLCNSCHNSWHKENGEALNAS